jgi:hypothetical protein
MSGHFMSGIGAFRSPSIVMATPSSTKSSSTNSRYRYGEFFFDLHFATTFAVPRAQKATNRGGLHLKRSTRVPQLSCLFFASSPSSAAT